MKAGEERPVFDRDEYYESSSRMMRWIVLALVLVTYPFDSTNGVVVLSLLVFTTVYNLLRYIPRLMRADFFASRVNALAVDHVFVLAIVILSGGLGSPYYPLLYLLIIGTIASYGIAGFAFSLSVQAIITVILLKVQLPIVPQAPEFQFIIKLVILIVFSLVAEQSVRSRDEEYLLEGRFTNRIQNERQRLLALINSLSAAVLAIDEKGGVYLYNAAALELLNTNRDISGTRISDLLPLHTRDGHRINLLTGVATESRTVNRQDLQFQASDNSDMILDLTVAPVRGYGKEGPNGYIVVFSDITKQKSLDEERDEFISVTSHELRTPLAIAEANLSTALLPGYAKIEDKAKKLFEQAHENVVFLSQLIEDLTTLSRAERGDLKLKAELIDVTTFTEELVRDYRPQAEAKHLKLDLDLGDKPGSIVTSAHELREVLQNFLTNAIKYTNAGNIVLSVTTAPGGTEFAVRDSGIGISASDKVKIFGKFYRSEDYRIRQTGGTGLGLYITHKLAEKLGATITFTSRLNHGSTFKVMVPARENPTITEQTAEAAQQIPKPLSH
ncbi:MAG TPA: ATP-binding protein [Candidatus Saccharimonadia bacterium]|nr:ATP-binding protein [Candidatus Saccharimonadia bacterium]